MVRALHTRTYMIGRGNQKSAVKASSYRSGSSVVAASAYRANDKIKSENDGRTHDYTRKKGVVFSNIFLPEKAPPEFADRSTLWNTVEKIENRKNSQFARQWEVSIPPQFSNDDRMKLVADFVNDFFVSQGMIADVALHDKGDGNAHIHVLLTLRRVDEKGFIGNKERIWNDRKLAGLWRVAWADRCNEVYKKMDLPTRIDPRSYEIQNNGLIPTKPLGKANHQLEKRGIATSAGNRNRVIMERNKKFMQTVLYDATVNLSSGEQRKEVEVMPTPEINREQLLKDQAELPGRIKEEKNRLSSLLEWQETFIDFEHRLRQAQSEGNESKINNIKSSIAEAKESFASEWGAVGNFYFHEEIKAVSESLGSLEDHYQKTIEYLELEGKGEKESNIVRVKFGERSQPEEELEIEEDPEQER